MILARKLLMGGKVDPEPFYVGSLGDFLRIDPATGDTVWSVSINSTESLAASLNGKIFIQDNADLYEYDEEGNLVSSNIGVLDAGATAISVNEDGSLVSVSDMFGSKNVHQYSSPTWGSDWTFTSFSDGLRCVARDPSGNTYAGSNDDTARKISSTGSQIWSNSYSSYNVLVMSIYNNSKIAIGLGSNAGVNQRNLDNTDDWTFTDPDLSNPIDMSYDLDGNIFVLSFAGIFKVSFDGALVWKDTTVSNNTDKICCDSNGDLISIESSFGGDNFIRKYASADGAVIWSKSLTERPKGVASPQTLRTAGFSL